MAIATRQQCPNKSCPLWPTAKFLDGSFEQNDKDGVSSNFASRQLFADIAKTSRIVTLYTNMRYTGNIMFKRLPSRVAE